MSLSLCSSTVNNTGELACDKSRGVLKKLFIFNGSISSSGYATVATLFNTLVANSKLSKSAANKIFVINEAQDIQDSGEQNTEGTLGLGFKAVLREGKPAYTIKFFGGADLLKRLRAFNNQTVRFFEWDANGTIWGTKSGTSFVGFQGKFFFTGNKLATGQNVEEGIITCTLSVLNVSEYYDNPVWESLGDYNIEDIKALIDVPMAYVSNASNVHKISMKIADSNLVSDYNIGPDFGTAIAALAANFSATIGGSALSITSIAYDSALQCLTVTYDSTGYSAGSGAIVLTPPTPTQLDAGDVTGVELIETSYTKP